MIGQYITKVNNNSFQEEGCSDAIKGINGTKYCVRLERHKQLQFIVTNREHGLIWNVIQEVKVQADDHRSRQFNITMSTRYIDCRWVIMRKQPRYNYRRVIWDRKQPWSQHPLPSWNNQPQQLLCGPYWCHEPHPHTYFEPQSPTVYNHKKASASNEVQGNNRAS